MLLFTVVALARLWIIVRRRIRGSSRRDLSAAYSLSRGRRVSCRRRPCSPRSRALLANHNGAGRRSCGRAVLPGSTSFPSLSLIRSTPGSVACLPRGAQHAGRLRRERRIHTVDVIAVLVAAAACTAAPLPRYWLAFTLFAGCLALGPFI